ncbi:MAG: metal-dependent transcriptional regulator [Chloroflexota bacterium]
MFNEITPASQDYLKQIYKLTEANGRSATTSELATALDLRPASVTGMIKKLAKHTPSLVVYEKHKGVLLTKEGQQVALELIRHHRLLETFLHEKLGYRWDEVHDEAERLEHVISEQMEQRMAELLGNPKRDPHGQRIPSATLEIQPTTAFPLCELKVGETAVIRRVNDDDPALLRHLASLKLRPRTTIILQAHSPFDQTQTLLLQGQTYPITIGQPVTSQIFVDRL